MKSFLDLRENKISEAVDPEETGGEAEIEMAMNQVKQMRHYLDGIEKMVIDHSPIPSPASTVVPGRRVHLHHVHLYAHPPIIACSLENVKRPRQIDKSLFRHLPISAIYHRM